MLCPECLENGNEVKLRVSYTTPDGPFRRLRHYVCLKCGWHTWNTETLTVDKGAPVGDGRKGVMANG